MKALIILNLKEAAGGFFVAHRFADLEEIAPCYK
jgi:hypothetical protein